MAEGKPGFWSTLPGVLTGAAALIASMTGLFAVFNRTPTTSTSAPAATAPAQAALTEPLAAGAATAVDHSPVLAKHAEVRATVVDPDGWTNLRAGPTASSAIVARINEGDIFWARPSDGLWWHARTADGHRGFVHRSRIRLNP